MKDFPKIQPLGETSILIQFEPEISEKLLEKVLTFKKILQKKYIKEKVEVINTYDSLLIIYEASIESIYDEILTLKTLITTTKIAKLPEKKIYYIPVCYEEEFGIDLKLIASEKNLSVSQIIHLHTHPIYTVYFIGFLPGFLYLGGLEKALEIPRKNSPRLHVEKGAVGIGGNQTGIYPEISPGGWQIIGNSPIDFFDKNSVPPCPISAGDKVKFFAVSKSNFLHIEEQVKYKTFNFKTEIYHG